MSLRSRGRSRSKRSAISAFTNRCTSPRPATRSQSNQVVSSLRQYALLLPRWVRRTSSPINSIGVPDGQHGQREEIFYLPVAQLFHGGIVGRSFHAAVPTQVVGRAIQVVVTVRFVVLGVVGHQVVQREAVMAGDEVDALLRLPLLVSEHVGAAGQPIGQRGHGAVVALEERPDIVTKPAVPFLPAVTEERADLVQAGGVPGFGDQLGVGKAPDPTRCPTATAAWPSRGRVRRGTGSRQDRIGSRRRASR